MKGTLAIKKRNELVEQYMECIDTVIYRNKPLLKAAHLERDDVYQSLALRLIQSVERYDSRSANGKSLEDCILMDLEYELYVCGGPQARYGFRDAPYFLQDAVVSINSAALCGQYWEMQLAV